MKEGGGVVRMPAASSQSFGGNDGMSVDTVEIEGPFSATGSGDTPSRQQIFVCRPATGAEEEPCARKILARLARRAYRRPATDSELQPLLAAYRSGRAEEGFEAGIQSALERLLVMPSFLLRVERDPANATAGTNYRTNDFELASRLSFFLWSTLPDDELVDLAAARKLSDPVVLDKQVRRMLGDPRSKALVDSFFSQWLSLRTLQAVTPDPDIFPDFDDSLRDAFKHETELFVESQLRDDRSALDLLTANYTYLNERLARFYGIPHVIGDHFRRVSLAGTARAGVLSHGSVLTATSYANRTSPVVRGKWLLDNIIGAPPPPPPPNVPALPDEGKVSVTTMRERMQRHRNNPVCANCHSRIDPMGFALENFNGIGKWRTNEGNTAIEPAGAFPDGTTFATAADFRNVLAGPYRSAVIRTITEKLLTYALGRGLEYYDMPTVRRIMRNAAPGNYRWSSLVMGIVTSTPFRMRTVQETKAAEQ